MKIVVAGASGFVGEALCTHLRQSGHEVLRLVRKNDAPDTAKWDPERGLEDPSVLEGCDALIHLGGKNIADARWNAKVKEELRSSRIQSTRTLVSSLGVLKNKPKIFLCASAVGVYGDRGNDKLDETLPPGESFLARLCADWEKEAARAESFGVPAASLRFGIVLGPGGGALQKMLLPFRLGIGGRLGSGNQYWSWISLVDAVRAIEFTILNHILGPINFVSPSSVTNQEFTKALGALLRRPTILPVPATALRVLFGREMANEMFLSSANVVPGKLARAGFQWRHPSLDGALRSALETQR